ncbi:MAG: multiple sugar transport system substrate-binding protein [Chloroflexota bacterium]|jgi:multiple sugar transport system substrate-binding protein|nr:multiple sugar transport system substrate-binding protein [Chloroflexota bacterium]
MDEVVRQNISRRRFLQLTAATAVVAACSPSTTGTGSSAPGGSTPAGGSPAGSSPAGSGGAPASGGAVSGTINVSYPDEAGLKPKYVEQAAAAVKKDFSGADVKIDLQKVGDDDFYTKLLLALDSGSGPDVFHVGGSSIGELADASYIEPLDDYVSQWADWSQYPDSVKNGVTYKGSVWAIPYGLDMRWLYYRKDDLTKAGLAADWQPANVQGILDAATAVKSANEPNVLPYALYAGPAGSSGTADHAFVPLLWAYGGELQDKDGKWIGDSPATRKVMAYYQKAYDGLSPKEILTSTKPWTAMREKLGNGGLALLFEGGWVYGGWATKDKAATEQNVGYVLHPTESGGPSFTIGGPGTCWYISSRSANKQGAWEFIKAMNSAEIVGKLNAEDPHPVARKDAADVAEFKSDPYLVASTEALAKARFTAPDPGYSKVIEAIQKATARVAAGELGPDDGAKRYTDDLTQALGADKVTSL